MKNKKLKVGVKTFLRNKDGKYLLVKRSPEFYLSLEDKDNLWEIAGGRIEIGETLIENLKREIQEEVQMDIINEPKLIGSQDIFPNDFHVVRLSFLSEVDGEPILDGKEHTEYAWLSFNELQDFEGVDKFTKTEINFLKEYLKNNE